MRTKEGALEKIGGAQNKAFLFPMDYVQPNYDYNLSNLNKTPTLSVSLEKFPH